MERRKHGGAGPTPNPMARVISEALDRVASPDARDSVMHLALSEAGLSEVPTHPAKFRRFALGALRRAMLLSLGEEFADAVLADLTPIIERAASTITSGPAHRAVRAQGTALIIGSQDPARAATWMEGAPPGTRCRVVDDVFDLVTGVDAMRRAQLSVVLDCAMPSVRPAALSTLARILPPNASVVLLGCPEVDKSTVPAEWSHLAGDASASDVVTVAFSTATSPASDAPAAEPQGPVRVLVIDEETTQRAAVASRLSAAGMEVSTAPDAFVGLEMATEGGHHVIVTASALSHLDGERFCALVKRVLGPEGPPVVVLVEESTQLVPGAAEVLVRGADDARLAEVVADCRR